MKEVCDVLHYTESYLTEIRYVCNVCYNVLFEGSPLPVARVAHIFHVRELAILLLLTVGMS